MLSDDNAITAIRTLHRTKRKLIQSISFLSVGGLHQKEKCLIFLFGWCNGTTYCLSLY